MTPDELAEIRTAFAIESSEMLAEMETALLSLQRNPQANEELHRLFRAVHTIKGSSSIVGAEHVELFCHELEHLLVMLREQALPLPKDFTQFLLHCHDHISRLIDAAAAGNDDAAPPPRHVQLLETLQTWHFSAVAVPEATAQQLTPLPEQEPQTAEENSTELPAALHNIVKLDAGKLDQLINLAVELVTVSSALEAHLKKSHDAIAGELASQVSDLVKLVQERAMLFRMVPVGDLFKRFQRLVNDLSSSGGKQIVLRTQGGDTELDKVMAEKIREPLVHLIRNAVDHGIESPHERTAAGKPPRGIIRLQAYQEAGRIVVEVHDDGRGISRDKVLQKALQRGLLRANEPSDQDLLALIFEPGFSTLDEATLLSGRGVGMDAVKRTVNELHGSISLSSTEGTGTTVKISLPLSLALIDGFMVMVGGVHYILPMELVGETIDLSQESQRLLQQRGYLDLRGHALPCIDLRSLLGATATSTDDRFIVVVNNEQRQPVGLAVDRLIGEVRAVIKPLGRLYRDITIISGATILGDGTLALILDLPELLRNSR